MDVTDVIDIDLGAEGLVTDFYGNVGDYQGVCRVTRSEAYYKALGWVMDGRANFTIKALAEYLEVSEPKALWMANLMDEAKIIRQVVDCLGYRVIAKPDAVPHEGMVSEDEAIKLATAYVEKALIAVLKFPEKLIEDITESETVLIKGLDLDNADIKIKMLSAFGGLLGFEQTDRG